ncbi:hypothetical protein FA10DRAFT_134301 [Acaromyces ingoldii]|uniref:Uncharacterized protein n=1 Tax=Acaromyces ingoldii TaxID=215250 RepID=A0A316YK58_9BASI|nr:hypothetical protein FA10DRAFT_134301 [Acaromyces ingoldii]PWN89008.1 hypothetical protein FA10DRAFT_134301 [Acaromyces ingoldii]
MNPLLLVSMVCWRVRVSHRYPQQGVAMRSFSRSSVLGEARSVRERRAARHVRSSRKSRRKKIKIVLNFLFFLS